MHILSEQSSDLQIKLVKLINSFQEKSSSNDDVDNILHRASLLRITKKVVDGLTEDNNNKLKDAILPTVSSGIDAVISRVKRNKIGEKTVVLASSNYTCVLTVKAPALTIKEGKLLQNLVKHGIPVVIAKNLIESSKEYREPVKQYDVIPERND